MRGSSWSVKITRTCFVGDLLLTSLAFEHFYFHLSQILVVARKKFPEAYLPMTSSRAKRQAARLQTSKSEPARFAHWKPLVFGFETSEELFLFWCAALLASEFASEVCLTTLRLRCGKYDCCSGSVRAQAMLVWQASD